jgi:hypothetical protein
VSDPRVPEDGPNWPERDLEENRGGEPGAGWSDDPYRYQPPPPNKPSDEPLEGEWSDSQPFEAEPPEPDPFAPDATPPRDDPWGFPPPRAEPEPTYEPAPTEPDFVSQPASWSDTWAEPQPARPPEEPTAPEPPAEAESPAEVEPMAPDEPPALEAPAPEPQPTYGYTPEPEPESEMEPEGEGEPEPMVEQEAEPEPDRDATDEFAAAGIAAETHVEEPEPESFGTEAHAAAALMAEAEADEAEPEPEPEYVSEPAYAPEPEPEPEPEPSAEAEPFPEPEYEADHATADEVAIEAAAASTAFGGPYDEDWDPKRDGNRRRPTTAEQAVPWLIGIILALAGIVIVLLALIFSSPTGLVSAQQSGSAQPSPSVEPSGSAGVGGPSTEPSGSGDPSPSASGEDSPEATPSEAPAFGALEMTYLGRPSAVAPIYLLLRDFSVAEKADVVAQAEQGVSSYANAPDGRVSAAVINGRAVALDKGGKARRLADNIRTLTFGWDAEMLYAVRIARDGNDDLARILEIDFVSGATRNLATVRYRHPDTGAEAPVKEAQFIDNGGLVRLYAVADGNLTLWVLGAPATYRIDPANGDVTEVGREPILWSTDGTQRVTVHEDGNNTALRLRDRGNNVIASTGVDGLVSHIRWAPNSNEIVFTIGVASSNGGVRQDLYVWDLEDRKDPMPLTSSGAAFGAEWRGVMCNWGP